MNRYRSILNEVKKAVIGKDDQLLKGENGHDAGAAGAILDEILRKTAQPLL